MFFTAYGKTYNIKCLSTDTELDISVAWNLECIAMKGKSWILTLEIIKLFRAPVQAQTLHMSQESGQIFSVSITGMQVCWHCSALHF